MAVILNIETSTNVCSVALSEDCKLIDYKESREDKSHSTVLTVFIDEMLKQNNITASELDAVAVSKGPGSYTGLRIGVSVAKGICYAVDKPAIGVSTLQLMALGVVNSNKFNSLNIDDIKKAWFCPMIDARRMEIYSAFFDFENKQKVKVLKLFLQELYKLSSQGKKSISSRKAEKLLKTIKTIADGNDLVIERVTVPCLTGLIAFYRGDLIRANKCLNTATKLCEERKPPMHSLLGFEELQAAVSIK